MKRFKEKIKKSLLNKANGDKKLIMRVESTFKVIETVMAFSEFLDKKPITPEVLDEFAKLLEKSTCEIKALSKSIKDARLEGSIAPKQEE